MISFRISNIKRLTNRLKERETVAFYSSSLILGNNFLPLSVAIGFSVKVITQRLVFSRKRKFEKVYGSRKV